MNERIPEPQTAVDPAASSAPAGHGLVGIGDPALEEAFAHLRLPSLPRLHAAAPRAHSQ